MKRLVPGPARSIAVRGVALLIAAAFGSTAFAEGSAAPAKEPTQKSAPTDKLVCKQEPVIGSNIKKRVCKTQSQIDEERDASRQSLNDLNQHAGRQQGTGG
jgi:hypothetical protein